MVFREMEAFVQAERKESLLKVKGREKQYLVSEANKGWLKLNVKKSSRDR